MLAAEEMYLRHAPSSSRMATPCSEDIGLLSSSNCPCAFGHASRDLDMVVHGDGFVVAGCGVTLLRDDVAKARTEEIVCWGLRTV